MLFDFRKILSRINILYIFAAAVNLFVLYKTKSRTPLMVLMAFSFIMLFYIISVILTKRFSKRAVYAVFIILCIAILAAGIGFIVSRNASALNSDSVWELFNRLSTGRLNIWQACLKLTSESPVFGAKDARYDEVLMEYCGAIHSPHNVYFSLMAVNGIPALLIYLFIIVYSIISAIKLIISMTEAEDKKRIYFCLAILVGYLVGDMFECFSIRSYMPSAYAVILIFAAIEAERLDHGRKVQSISHNSML